MFVGHLAVSLGTRAVTPRLPLSILIAASFGLDFLWPVFLLLGLERVQVTPGSTAFTPLTFESYPWSHSLLMVLCWAVLAGWCVARTYSGLRDGLVVGAVVVSHWVLDFVTHAPDLPLWPAGPRTGLGLWNSIPATLMVEGGLLVAGLALYLRHVGLTRRGRRFLWFLVGLTVSVWVSQPWAPPAPGPGIVAATGLALWILPFWGYWIESSRVDGSSRGM